MDVYTLRIAASAWNRQVRPYGAAQRLTLMRPHSPLPAVAYTPPVPAAPTAPVTLGVLARPSELDAVVRLVRSVGREAAETIVLFDAESPLHCDLPGAHRVRKIVQPLQGEFAAARNTLQAAARTGWVLQIDTDEMLPQGALTRLSQYAAAVGVQGVRSVGLRRRNLVGGFASDLWPDVQYRLNRREVRFTGRVHERPDRPWQHSTIALHPVIVHRLDRVRVLERSRRYEALARGGGRPSEMSALLTPFSP